MTSAVRQYINSIPDKRISLALIHALDNIFPTSSDTARTATAGGVQATASALKAGSSFHEVGTVATAADAVVLPPARVGEFHFVKNSGAASMQVFAPTPDTIDSVATATGVSHPAGDAVLYVCLVNGNYIRLGSGEHDLDGLTASVAELNYLDLTTLGTGAASKAVVLDSGDDYTWPATGVLTAGLIKAVGNVFARGRFLRAQAAPVAKTVTAGITAAELIAGLITSTGASAPSSHQLPTGTEIDAVIPGVATGDSFDFHLVNIGAGAGDDATIAVNTDVTIVGNPTAGATDDETISSGSAHFRARRSAANAYVVYRVA